MEVIRGSVCLILVIYLTQVHSEVSKYQANTICPNECILLLVKTKHSKLYTAKKYVSRCGSCWSNLLNKDIGASTQESFKSFLTKSCEKKCISDLVQMSSGYPSIYKKSIERCAECWSSIYYSAENGVLISPSKIRMITEVLKNKFPVQFLPNFSKSEEDDEISSSSSSDEIIIDGRNMRGNNNKGVLIEIRTKDNNRQIIALNGLVGNEIPGGIHSEEEKWGTSKGQKNSKGETIGILIKKTDSPSNSSRSDEHSQNWKYTDSQSSDDGTLMVGHETVDGLMSWSKNNEQYNGTKLEVMVTNGSNNLDVLHNHPHLRSSGEWNDLIPILPDKLIDDGTPDHSNHGQSSSNDVLSNESFISSSIRNHNGPNIKHDSHEMGQFWFTSSGGNRNDSLYNATKETASTEVSPTLAPVVPEESVKPNDDSNASTGCCSTSIQNVNISVFHSSPPDDSSWKAGMNHRNNSSHQSFTPKEPKEGPKPSEASVLPLMYQVQAIQMPEEPKKILPSFAPVILQESTEVLSSRIPSMSRKPLQGNIPMNVSHNSHGSDVFWNKGGENNQNDNHFDSAVNFPANNQYQTSLHWNISVNNTHKNLSWATSGENNPSGSSHISVHDLHPSISVNYVQPKEILPPLVLDVLGESVKLPSSHPFKSEKPPYPTEKETPDPGPSRQVQNQTGSNWNISLDTMYGRERWTKSGEEYPNGSFPLISSMPTNPKGIATSIVPVIMKEPTEVLASRIPFISKKPAWSSGSDKPDISGVTEKYPNGSFHDLVHNSPHFISVMSGKPKGILPPLVSVSYEEPTEINSSRMADEADAGCCDHSTQVQGNIAIKVPDHSHRPDVILGLEQNQNGKQNQTGILWNISHDTTNEERLWKIRSGGNPNSISHNMLHVLPPPIPVLPEEPSKIKPSLVEVISEKPTVISPYPVSNISDVTGTYTLRHNFSSQGEADNIHWGKDDQFQNEFWNIKDVACYCKLKNNLDEVKAEMVDEKEFKFNYGHGGFSYSGSPTYGFTEGDQAKFTIVVRMDDFGDLMLFNLLKYKHILLNVLGEQLFLKLTNSILTKITTVIRELQKFKSLRFCKFSENNDEYSSLQNKFTMEISKCIVNETQKLMTELLKIYAQVVPRNISKIMNFVESYETHVSSCGAEFELNKIRTSDIKCGMIREANL